MLNLTALGASSGAVFSPAAGEAVGSVLGEELEPVLLPAHAEMTVIKIDNSKTNVIFFMFLLASIKRILISII